MKNIPWPYGDQNLANKPRIVFHSYEDGDKVELKLRVCWENHYKFRAGCIGIQFVTAVLGLKYLELFMERIDVDFGIIMRPVYIPEVSIFNRRSKIQ